MYFVVVLRWELAVGVLLKGLLFVDLFVLAMGGAFTACWVFGGLRLLRVAIGVLYPRGRRGVCVYWMLFIGLLLSVGSFDAFARAYDICNNFYCVLVVFIGLLLSYSDSVGVKFIGYGVLWV